MCHATAVKNSNLSTSIDLAIDPADHRLISDTRHQLAIEESME